MKRTEGRCGLGPDHTCSASTVATAGHAPSETVLTTRSQRPICTPIHGVTPPPQLSFSAEGLPDPEGSGALCSDLPLFWGAPEWSAWKAGVTVPTAARPHAASPFVHTGRAQLVSLAGLWSPHGLATLQRPAVAGVPIRLSESPPAPQNVVSMLSLAPWGPWPACCLELRDSHHGRGRSGWGSE